MPGAVKPVTVCVAVRAAAFMTDVESEAREPKEAESATTSWKRFPAVTCTVNAAGLLGMHVKPSTTVLVPRRAWMTCPKVAWMDF